MRTSQSAQSTPRAQTPLVLLSLKAKQLQQAGGVEGPYPIGFRVYGLGFRVSGLGFRVTLEVHGTY